MTPWLVIGISGVTCGGKSTLSSTIYNYLKSPTCQLKENVHIKDVKLINQDDYFLEIDDPHHIRIEKLNHINWEVITSIDINRMCNDISDILGMQFCLYNCNYDTTKVINGDVHEQIKHIQQITFPMFLNVLIIEGFLIFNHPFILDLCNIKFHLHLPYEKCYARRIKRVYNPPDVTGYFEMCVWPMYEKHFKEFKDRNDIFILNGDVSKEKCFNYVLKCIQNVL